MLQLRCPNRKRFRIQPASDSLRFELRFLRYFSIDLETIIDLLMGLFRGAVFHHGGVPENCPLVLMGRFRSLMGRFPTLMGPFPRMP